MKHSVKSFSYDRRNFYANKHEQIFESAQAQQAKKSYASSGGQSIDLPFETFRKIEIFQEGQLTVYRAEGVLVGEYSYGADFLSVNRCDCLLDSYKKNFRTLSVEGAVSFLSPGSYNIHHFFFEVLPVIYAHRKTLRGRRVLVPGTQGGGRFYAEFNKLLGLEIDFVQVPLNSRVIGSDIDVYGTFPFRIYPVELIEEIREEIWRKLKNFSPPSKDSIIYLGRGDLERNRRKIINEVDLFEALQTLGKTVKVIRPGLENLQNTIISLMFAREIIGPTGGALFHLLWSQNLEVFHELKPLEHQSMSESEELSEIFTFSYSTSETISTDPSVFWSLSDQSVDIEGLISNLSNRDKFFR